MQITLCIINYMSLCTYSWLFIKLETMIMTVYSYVMLACITGLTVYCAE